MKPITDRFAFKIAGASGQGINTVGEILAYSLKAAGYSIFAYREYPSLIKGGHATYQIDFANYQISSSKSLVDAVIVLNKQKTDWHLQELRPGGIIFHDIDNPRINIEEEKLILEKQIKLIYIPALNLAEAVGGNELMTNIVSLGNLWKLLKLDYKCIEAVVSKTFASKPAILDIDLKCLKQGYDYVLGALPEFGKRLIKSDEISPEAKLALHTKSETDLHSWLQLTTPGNFASQYLITGNEALAIGAINGGVRAHYAYPMTPSSSILDYLAGVAAETGMIVKQAEDEITAAAMALGSMHAGTRALTATSGGGFDLMTEHISLAGIIETPFVCVLAQRPGPATGLPTWTTQGDLWLAIHGGHGEFARCVIAVRDPEDAFQAIQEAFNIAEKYQMVVIVLTDKLIAETYYTVASFEQNKVAITRGQLITDQIELGQLVSADRYALTETGVSKRWLPGAVAAGYNANSDEHDSEGNVTEAADITEQMIVKRLRKQDTLLASLPEPELHWNNVDLKAALQTYNLIGWGSTYGVAQDVLKYYESFNIKVNYLHVKYIWPLRTRDISDFLETHQDAVLLESNHNGQLAELIRQQTGKDIRHKFLKWDGRPFFLEEVINYLEALN